MKSLIEREVTRKKYIANLEDRTPEQRVEEEALFIEIKRLEQNERRFKRERDELLRTLAGIDCGLPDVVEDEGLFSLPLENTKKKFKKGMAGDLDSPTTSLAPFSAPITRRPQTAKNAAFGTETTLL